MTRDQALKLKVDRDTVFIFEPSLNDVHEARVIGVKLTHGNDSNSDVLVTAHSGPMSSRFYKPSEIHNSEVEAWEVYSRRLACESDKALNLKHHIDNKILKLKKEKTT